ncbi:ATP-binding protein [Thermococcus sp. GR7]|uniref:ATP-binding protein n=1 Tax=unclassified Thermococcus TaxID=2627626 RepID=UPI001431FBA9|nr:MULTISPECIES: ATP-binding protein [unclassified Thermococcus]NJE45879.1 ATP-binding protein [Thermococcus sp. GR7]NJE78770.1 ATP-binding protein [Thermococcus sp. GR4]NJF22074.1 ATP-binding protein [Thermococcus sp. GR5]
MGREETIAQIVMDYLNLSVEGVERELRVSEDIRINKAITIIGPRRAGKTFYILQKFSKLRKAGKAAVFFPLDDDRIYPPTPDDLSTLVRVFYELFPDADEKYLFLDEIQNVPNWELFVKRVMERDGFRVYLTGSSSKLLSREIATALRGRTLTFEMLPFSFREFLRVKGIEVGRYLSTREEAVVKTLLREYLEFGGFPEVVLIEDTYLKRKTLSEYVDVMLYRDVVERHGVKNLKAVRLFLKLLITSFAKEFSVNRTARYMKGIGVDVSKNTLYSYFDYFEEAYVIFPLKKFSYNLREVEKSLPKVYVVDTGLINVYSLRFGETIGRLIENAVFLELRRREKELYYFKDERGREVDFLVKDGKDISELIQVSYSLEAPETFEREISALVNASEKLDCENLTIINWNRDDILEVGGKKVRLIPLWKFLLGGEGNDSP